MTISKVGVVGCGLMGGGIAQVVAQSGYATTVVEADQGLLDRGLHAIHESLDGLVDKGRLAPGAARRRPAAASPGPCGSRISGDVDLVIEAITENPAIKKETFARLDRVCASARHPGVEHLVVHDHRAGRRDEAAPRRCSGSTSSIRLR